MGTRNHVRLAQVNRLDLLVGVATSRVGEIFPRYVVQSEREDLTRSPLRLLLG